MREQSRRVQLVAGAVGIALVAGLIGFLVSRPESPLVPVTPTPLTTVGGVLPPATAGYSVADDLATHQVVVFGGIADNQATWIWNGSRWNLAQPETSPPGRIDAATAYDPALHLVLLFGGHGPPGTDLRDTWAWGGASWRELDAGAGAPPPSDAVMAWDPAQSDMVLVAGAPTGASTGTWIWSGARWTRAASGLPFPPSNASLAFDPSSGQLLAAGFPPSGTTVAASTQLWGWAGVSWHEISVSETNPPKALAVQGLGWNPASRRITLFGVGASRARALETWLWDGAAWEQSPSDNSLILSGSIVSSETLLLLVGALDENGVVPTSIKVWMWSPDAWTAA
ncbi:MAG TPA: hypothetical protein VI434_05665 [Candidatus Dormibacteraeota bacterium]